MLEQSRKRNIGHERARDSRACAEVRTGAKRDVLSTILTRLRTTNPRWVKLSRPLKNRFRRDWLNQTSETPDLQAIAVPHEAQTAAQFCGATCR